MATIKSFILIILLTFLGIQNAKAQEDFSKSLGIALKASNNGLGADAVLNFHKRMDVRLGYETFNYSKDLTFEEEDMNYDTKGNIKLGGLSLLFDYYLAKHVFLSLGGSFNVFHGQFDGVAANGFQFGDIVIPKEDGGDFKFGLDPAQKLTPYFGLGFGRTLGLKNNVGFAFEMGGFYLGAPDISIQATGILSPTCNPDQQHEPRLERQFSQYRIYPVLKFSLSYKITSF